MSSGGACARGDPTLCGAARSRPRSTTVRTRTSSRLRPRLLTAAAALVGCLALPPSLRAADGGPDAAVELELAGLVPLGGDGACILVLREKGASTILPLLLPATSAQALQADLRAKRTPGMLGEALRALGARVREVEIAAAEETVEAAHVRLRQGARQLDVTGKPSEAVALALSTGAPILIRRKLLTQAGVTPQELERARERAPDEGEDVKL